MMHASQFHKTDPYDWFCAPGSEMVLFRTDHWMVLLWHHCENSFICKRESKWSSPPGLLIYWLLLGFLWRPGRRWQRRRRRFHRLWSLDPCSPSLWQLWDTQTQEWTCHWFVPPALILTLVRPFGYFCPCQYCFFDHFVCVIANCINFGTSVYFYWDFTISLPFPLINQFCTRYTK